MIRLRKTLDDNSLMQNKKYEVTAITKVSTDYLVRHCRSIGLELTLPNKSFPNMDYLKYTPCYPTKI